MRMKLCHWLRIVGQDWLGLVPYPSEAIGWCLWLPGFFLSDLPDGWDWVLYLVVDGVMN